MLNVGEKANKIFKDFIYKDTIYQIGLTPNRADATSHLGIARDILLLSIRDSLKLITNFCSLIQ